MVSGLVDGNGVARHDGRCRSQRCQRRGRRTQSPAQQPSEGRSMSGRAPDAISRARRLIEPALRAAVEQLEDEQMRRVASYQLGGTDPAGRPVEGGGGKAIRPTLAMLSAEAGGGSAEDGIASAVAV